MKVVDGSYGEGGGQILRTTVAISCIIGEPVKIVNIRAKRPQPGLKRQHMTAIKAAATLCSAEVEGLKLGSRTLTFRPGSIKGGNYRFDIGTAGSITLVLQTITPIMAYSPQPVEVTITGGTDVPWSPPIDYFRNVIAWHLRDMGYELSMALLRRGHYPRGGGMVRVHVLKPPRSLTHINKVRRGEVRVIKGISHCVKLPKHVAERQAKSAKATLIQGGVRAPVEIQLEYYEPRQDPHLGPGSGIVLWAEAGNTVIGADALGAKGKRAEVVGSEAAQKLLKELATGAALDRHMSDNILLYAALAEGESRVGGSELTMHAHTVIWLIRQLLSVNVELSGGLGKPFTAVIKGAGIKA